MLQVKVIHLGVFYLHKFVLLLLCSATYSVSLSQNIFEEKSDRGRNEVLEDIGRRDRNVAERGVLSLLSFKVHVAANTVGVCVKHHVDLVVVPLHSCVFSQQFRLQN